MRWTLLSAAAVGVALITASPAMAGTLTTQNSCKWSIDSVWRHLDVGLTGTASPSPVAPGSGLNLTGTSVHVTLPDYLALAGHGLGVLTAGDNAIQAKAWVALSAPGTPQGTQVFSLETVAHTTIVEDASGAFVSSTPIDVTVPIPDSAWTAGSVPVLFGQAGAGTLPPVPAGVSGGAIQPLGSAFISASIGSGGIKLNIDCQPATGEGKSVPAPFTASPFETVAIDAGAPVITAPVVRKPVVALRTTKLKRSGKQVAVSIACSVAVCKGSVAMTKATKKVAYALAAGARKTVTFALSNTTVKALEKRSLLVSVKITADGGQTVTKKLRLK